MISEVCNAIVLTYIASEYLISEQQQTQDDRKYKNRSSSSSSSSAAGASRFQQYQQRQRIKTILIFAVPIIILINILDRVTGAMDMMNQLLDGFLHLPRAIFAATLYIIALYVDVTILNRKETPTMTPVTVTTTTIDGTTPSSTTTTTTIQVPIKFFLKQVFVAFMYILPAYPFMAVVISFVFMFVINIWEALNLPLEYLNAPIYYGTLYGPFAWVYVHVKQKIILQYYNNQYYSLPS